MKIPYARQWISEDDIEKISEVLRSDYLTTGPFVQAFEEAFAKYVGAKFAVAVANGTAALHLAAKALGVKDGSEVITTPMSFAATSNCVLYNSGTPVFADITDRGIIDPSMIEERISERSCGIIPVHYMGLPCELEEISRIAKENDLFVLEDACHALGAKYQATSVGDCSHSNLAVFSFHPVKHITTGEGGMITTNDRNLDGLLRELRTHGITKDKTQFKTNHTEPWYQEMHQLGFNYRLTDIQAALGLNQLSKVDQFIKRRRDIAQAYSDFFESFTDQVETIQEKEHETHSYHLYVVKLVNKRERKELFEFLTERGIHCQVHYIPIYWHPYYRQSGFAEIRCPNAESFYDRILSLPMYPSLSDDELSYVLSSLEEFLGKS